MTPESIGPCLERVQLEQLSAGLTADEDVSRHLDSCTKCQEALASIQGENELLGEFLGANADRFEQDESYQQPIEGYEIIHELHRGGQGVVYEAEQITTRRTVAIKMMLQGRFATSKQRQRFDREVEIIAGLQHPWIVTLYESGRARGGEVYFAMEFVRGTTLDQWVRALEPSIEQRVTLFAEVCEAVRYAHGRGIIHRDLKPGNILVDEENHPHVLDFGLARVADPDGAEADRIATMAGEFLGTFAYAAPEQLEGDPTRIDVRTDVFALGILLYELLCGQRPFDMGQSLADLVQNRIGRPPAPPSSHDPAIARDLDVICLKALSVEPERRYGSAGELEEDLRRHLDGRPILARADSTTYVLARMVRRHKLPFSAAVLVLLLAIGSAIGFAVLASRAEARQRLAEERLAAFTDFIGLFNFYTGEGKDGMLVEDAVVLMGEKVKKQYQDQPELASTVLTAVGLMHLSFDRRRDAQEAFELVLELRKDADPRDKGEAHHNLGRLWMDEELYGAAHQQYKRAYELRMEGLGEHEDTAMTLQHLGASQRKQGNLDEAEEYYRQAEAMLRSLGVFEGVRGAQLFNSLAQLERSRAARAVPEEKEESLEKSIRSFISAAALTAEHVPEQTDYRHGRAEQSVGSAHALLAEHYEATGQLGLAVERQGMAVARYDRAYEILTIKGKDSDEVLRVVVNRAESRLALNKAGYSFRDNQLELGRTKSTSELREELLETAEEVRSAALTQTERAPGLSSSATWITAAKSWELLAEIEELLGLFEERARSMALARESRQRAEDWSSLESESPVLKPQGE